LSALPHLKVAIAHYWCINERGGEKVLKNLLDIFPQADVYTLFYDPSSMGHILKGHRVFTSNLNKPILRKHYTKCFPFFSQAVQSLKLQDSYDILISSESGPIKGISKPKELPHLCYTHTPMRYCWGHTEEYLRDLPYFIKPLAKLAFEKLRKYDVTTIDNVDQYLANSNHVAKRIKKYYDRDSIVVHPPISDKLFEKKLLPNTERTQQHYLSFGALVPYKRIDLLIECFKNRKDKLIIIGEGSERKRLEPTATDNITFTGSLEWNKIEHLIEQSKALIFPGEEDFGLIPLEVMALGCPVIAFKKGGALETVIENSSVQESSGLFFENQTSDSLNQALNEFEVIKGKFSPEWMRSHAQKFSQSVFKSKLLTQVKHLLNLT